jgi:hypothetical protein
LTVIREHHICTTADLLPFRAGAFDTVLCIDTLTHIPEPFLERSVREMMCVCAGSLVLAIDCADPTKEGHLTMRPRSWWLERLSALGLNSLPDQDSRLVRHPRIPAWNSSSAILVRQVESRRSPSQPRAWFPR